jgi:unsaturated rhamnogalacturonyl hydrolase
VNKQSPRLLLISIVTLLPILARAQTVYPPLSTADSSAMDSGTQANPKVKSKPAYPIPYRIESVKEIKATLDRVLGYLDKNTPVKVGDLDTGKRIYDLNKLPDNPGLDPTEYYLTSYEWGVTYNGMLLAADALKDPHYKDYVSDRLAAVAAIVARQRPYSTELRYERNVPLTTLSRLLVPMSMDECGSMCASMIKAMRAGIYPDALRPIVDNDMELIAEQRFRLDDGTLARKHPYPHTLWLDDLYMGVPALAQMGLLTGDHRYWDDAILQVNNFSKRMFIPEKGIFMHGWAQEMDPHPAYCWGRANGWAAAAMAELLTVLPDNYPGRDSVLKIYRAHMAGLAALQDKDGLWHQLLDRNDTYLETSASALFVYAMARGVNHGWLNLYSYGSTISLGWNAIANQVNSQGQIENVCMGTGMAFDPMFYSYRPRSVWASHGFGPVLLAGAEMATYRQGKGKVKEPKPKPPKPGAKPTPTPSGSLLPLPSPAPSPGPVGRFE